VPAGAALRAGATLSNAGAVATGMSAAALKHPTQPVCVVGWNGIPIPIGPTGGGGRGR